MSLRLSVTGLLTILLLTFFCFGCGKNEHEIEPDIEDKYGYSGTWFGQVDVNTILVFNILPKEEPRKSYFSKAAFTYDMVNFFYMLSSKGTLNDQEITLTWEMAIDERQADARRDDGTLAVFGGGTFSSNFGFKNTGGWGHMRHDGKKLLLVNDKNETVKFVREDDYDDLIDEFCELKEKVEKDITKTLRSRYPNAKIKIIDNSQMPPVVVK